MSRTRTLGQSRLQLAGVVAVAYLLGAASQARTQSIVEYRLALGGDNHASQIVLNPPYYPRFTPGSELDGQQYAEGNVITWDIRPIVSGIHAGTTGDLGVGRAPSGASALTFHLELRVATASGPLADIGAGSATAQGWFSTTDPQRNAAFCSSYDVGGRGTTGGHVYDASSLGGPNLKYYSFPIANGRPAAVIVPRGRLDTMGALSIQWSGSTAYVPGVGMPPGGLGGCSGGLGIVPVFEGQINTAGMAPGTYVLKTIPSATLIYRGDFNCSAPLPLYPAFRPNQTRGDTISFQLLPDPPPTLVGATSRRSHGAVGTFDIPLPLDSPAQAGIESRSYGPQQVILTFSEAIKAVDGSPDGTEVNLSSGTLGMVSINGAQMTVNLSGTSDQSCLVITLSGIADLRDHLLSGDNNIHIRILKADVNADGVVASADITQVQSVSGSEPDPSTFRCDINADGIIGSADLTTARANSGHVAACP